MEILNNNNISESTNYWPLIFLSVGVVGLLALSWWWLATTINNPEKQGQFGDQFGAVNEGLISKCGIREEKR